MVDGAAEAAHVASGQKSALARSTRRALSDAKRHLTRSALKLAGYVVVAFLVLKLIPALKQALRSLEHVRWQWLLGALLLEILSETGFVIAWRAIVDPENVLSRDGRGARMDTRVAWAQLGSGMLVPGGSWGGVGVGTWILHRFGIPTKLAVERQFNLSFLNTAIDGIAVIVFGLALATGVLPGARNPLLTLLPAAVTAIALVAVLLIARRASTDAARLQPKHAKIAGAVVTLATAVHDTQRLLVHRGNYRPLLGVLAYLGFDVLVLWSAFSAVHAHPVPGFGVVVLAYIIGALGGSIPLPAAVGTVGGMAGMLILYGVSHDVAVAAVLLHQAISLLVPLAGGGISYMILRHSFGPIRTTAKQ